MTQYKEVRFPQKVSLDGDWNFTYTQHIEEKENIEIPSLEAFTVKMPVPGYWDDNIDRMQSTSFWGGMGATAKFNPDFRHIDFPMGDNMPPDASLPYLEGVGWYKRGINVPNEWRESEVTLFIGGVLLEAWVWVNDELIKYHLGHSTPFEVSLGKHLKYGEENQIIIAVANTRKDRLGCVIRGFKGFSAGIYRSVYIKVAGRKRIKDCYIHTILENRQLKWFVEIEGEWTKSAILNWCIREQKDDAVIANGSIQASEKSIEWITDTFNMRSWSDNNPKLYDIELELCEDEKIIDKHTQKFGLRLLKREGTTLKLNGRPVFLRGATEHAYFPITCTPPNDIETYRQNIKKLKELGFNWLRFHTWVPSEEYMNAADELGMMIQVEPPLGFVEQEWLDILYTCRKHPSVIIYCCGNEEMLDKKKIEQLKLMAKLCHKIVPDALFNPQEAMRGIEYMLSEEEEIEIRPFPHNPKRLEAIREFSDVFGQYPLGLLSYNSCKGDWRTLNERLKIYNRPCLSHEITIHGNYLNLDLEHRYEGTRIGAEIFASVRRNLKKEGLLSRAAVYYKNSCKWMKILRKHTVETARMCKYNSGYDLLGAIDYHWHRCGYPCGIMNEFYELKPGESREDVIRYNGESVILLDCTNNRNIKSGDVISLDFYASLFGETILREGNIEWYLADDKHKIFQRGKEKVTDICNGEVEKLLSISFETPRIEKSSKITLYARLSGGEYEITNQWDFWIFPKDISIDSNISIDNTIADKYKSILVKSNSNNDETKKNLKIVSKLDKDTIDYISDGGSVLMIGSTPFPTLPTTYQLAVTGRVQGNLATVIEDHPLMNDFPHEGFCDWQFYIMIEEGETIVFNDLSIPFRPIVEVVSTFKLIRKQASLFEMGIGNGKLLVCTLNLKGNLRKPLEEAWKLR